MWNPIKDMKKLFKKFKDEVNRGLGKVRDSVNSGVREVNKAKDSGKYWVTKRKDDALKELGEVKDDLRHGVEDGIKSLSHKAEELGGELEDKAEEAVENALDRAQEAAKKVSEEISAEGIKKSLDTAADVIELISPDKFTLILGIELALVVQGEVTIQVAFPNPLSKLTEIRGWAKHPPKGRSKIIECVKDFGPDSISVEAKVSGNGMSAEWSGENKYGKLDKFLEKHGV